MHLCAIVKLLVLTLGMCCLQYCKFYLQFQCRTYAIKLRDPRKRSSALYWTTKNVLCERWTDVTHVTQTQSTQCMCIRKPILP